MEVVWRFYPVAEVAGSRAFPCPSNGDRWEKVLKFPVFFLVSAYGKCLLGVLPGGPGRVGPGGPGGPGRVGPGGPGGPGRVGPGGPGGP